MSWLLPVGTPGGINSGFDGIPDGSGIVRLGEEIIYLDLNLYRLWRAVAAAPQAMELRTWANAQGILAVDDCIRALKDAELLIEEGPDIQRRVGRLGFRLIGECLGNGKNLDPMFLVLGRNNAQLRVDVDLFELLMRCDGVSPISMMCSSLDASRPHSGWPPCIETLIAGLPTLVRNEVIQLEAALQCTDLQ